MKTRGPTRLLTGVVLGAGAALLFDPTSGERRRSTIRFRVNDAISRMGERTRRMRDGLSVRARTAIDRAERVTKRVRSMSKGEGASDSSLARRVRTKLERAASRPRAIGVTAYGGRITLHGDVLPHEHEQVLSTVRSVSGVDGLTDHLTERASNDHAWSSQGGSNSQLPRRFDLNFWQEHWSPGARFVTGALGGILLVAAARRRTPLTILAGLAGSTLLLRTATNKPLKRLGPRHGTIDVQKDLVVKAPVERVFRLLEAYENYPAFMRNVRAVTRDAEGISHWVVAGPGRSALEWDSVTTVHRPNEMLAWRSLPNSRVEHSGSIRFEPVGQDQTRLGIRMSYSPPAGALGHTVAKLFGVDPSSELDEDLGRVKTFVETGGAGTLPESLRGTGGDGSARSGSGQTTHAASG